MLRKIRIFAATFCFVLITLLFLDFTGTIHAWFGWLAKIQFWPALLALNVGVVVGLVILTLLLGRLNKKCYPLMWNLIDSHDTARFLHLCNDNKKKQHLAAAFQLLLPGMPMIYYGDEFAMPGANDPDCRRGMYWDEEYQDKEMFEWYKQLLKVRKNHACIVEGEPIEIAARDEEETIVLTRKNGEETLALIFNCSSSARMFNEYAQKYDLLRENPFDGKIEGLDAAVIVL